MPPPGPGPRGSLLSPLHSGPARHPRARSRRSLSPLSVSPVPPGPAQAGRTPALAGRARPSPFRARAPPPPLPPAGTGSPPTRHLELQQLLGLLRRQLPLLRRRHFVAASDPSLRHSPELTSAHPHFRPGSRARARARGAAREPTAFYRPQPEILDRVPEKAEALPDLSGNARISSTGLAALGCSRWAREEFRSVPKAARTFPELAGGGVAAFGRGSGSREWRPGAPRERVGLPLSHRAGGSCPGTSRPAGSPVHRRRLHPRWRPPVKMVAVRDRPLPPRELRVRAGGGDGAPGPRPCEPGERQPSSPGPPCPRWGRARPVPAPAGSGGAGSGLRLGPATRREAGKAGGARRGRPRR